MTSPRRSLQFFPSESEALYQAAMKNEAEFLKILKDEKLLEKLGKNTKRLEEMQSGIDLLPPNQEVLENRAKLAFVMSGGYLFDLCKKYANSPLSKEVITARTEILKNYIDTYYYNQLFARTYDRSFGCFI